jgi:hypothetical protein
MNHVLDIDIVASNGLLDCTGLIELLVNKVFRNLYEKCRCH